MERFDARVEAGAERSPPSLPEPLLRHSGVFVGRQYATFAGITHGQKVHDFIARVLAHQYARPIALGPNGRTRIYHVHYKPMYAAIGDPDNRHRRRLTIEQAIERLLVLDGVLMDPSLTWLGTEREKRAHFGALPGLDLRDHEYPRLVFGRAPRQTVRFFPDKLPIGHGGYGRTHVFLYPVHSVASSRDSGVGGASGPVDDAAQHARQSRGDRRRHQTPGVTRCRLQAWRHCGDGARNGVSRRRVVRRGERELCPLSRAAGATCAPNYGADTTTERSEGVVEAAGVEPASERTSS